MLRIEPTNFFLDMPAVRSFQKQYPLAFPFAVLGAFFFGFGFYNEVSRALDENFVFAFFGYLLIGMGILVGASFGAGIGFLISFIYRRIKRQ